MRKCYFALMVLLVALVSVGFAACGDDEPKVADFVVGTWQYDNHEMLNDNVLLFQFTRDGKFHLVSKYIGSATDYYAYHGTYTVKGYKLIVTFDPSPLLSDESETIEFDYSVEGDKLLLFTNSETLTLIRVNNSVIEPYL